MQPVVYRFGVHRTFFNPKGKVRLQIRENRQHYDPYDGGGEWFTIWRWCSMQEENEYLTTSDFDNLSPTELGEDSDLAGQIVSWLGTTGQLIGAVLLAGRYLTPSYCYGIMSAGAAAWFLVACRQRNYALMVLNGTYIVINIIGMWAWP